MERVSEAKNQTNTSARAHTGTNQGNLWDSTLGVLSGVLTPRSVVSNPKSDTVSPNLNLALTMQKQQGIGSNTSSII